MLRYFSIVLVLVASVMAWPKFAFSQNSNLHIQDSRLSINQDIIDHRCY
jgi:hypothetical protein